MFMALFFFTGVGNSSTFQMIPNIVGDYVPRLMPGLDADETRRHVERESAAITAFTSAIAAYGAFFIPKAYGSSIAATGSANLALWGFVAFYVICLAVTWVWYDRPGGLLHDIERRSAAADPARRPARLTEGASHEPSSRPPELLPEEDRRHLRGRPWRD